MSSPLDQAYLSSVLLARALESAGHPKAADAFALKEAIARAVTHPDSMTEESFTKAWGRRGQFEGLELGGEMGDAIHKHATLLASAQLQF